MRGGVFYNSCFLLVTLLVLVAGCAKAPEVVEQPKPVEQPAQVTPIPTEVVPPLPFPEQKPNRTE